MLKTATLLFTFFLGQLKSHREKPNSFEAIINSLMIHLRGFLSLTALGFTGLVLSLVGFFAAYFNLLQQFDNNNNVYLSAVASGGLIVLLIGLVMLYQVRSQMKMASPAAPAPVLQSTASPLETALSALVLDYVKDRELKREVLAQEVQKAAVTAANSFAARAKPPEHSEHRPAEYSSDKPRSTVGTFSTDGTGVVN